MSNGTYKGIKKYDTLPLRKGASFKSLYHPWEHNQYKVGHNYILKVAQALNKMKPNMQAYFLNLSAG